MVIQVNQELCTGCGVCIDACSVGAIQLVDQRAVIDDALCTACEVCIEACSNEAISTRSMPEPSVSIVTLPAAEAHPVPVWEKAALPEKALPARGLVPLAGAALGFLGRELAPRLVDVVVNTLERRLARSTTTTAPYVSTPTRVRTTGGRGERRQTRYRSGCTGNRNHKGRR
jgi:NAD-dependent dihydropyrimidine dehydrogenase PreA subunit